MTPAEKFIPLLSWSKRTGPGRWIARCPSHKDKSPSLTITEKADSKLLVHCHAQCEVAAIVGAVGLSLRDLMPEKISGDYKPPDRTAFHAADVLSALADELTFAYIVMSDLQKWLADERHGQPPGPDVRARFLEATERVQAGAEMASGRRIKADEARRAVIAAGILREHEVIQIREFVNAEIDLRDLPNPVPCKAAHGQGMAA